MDLDKVKKYQFKHGFRHRKISLKSDMDSDSACT